MGNAALFTPPAIHKTNIVILPRYLAKSRLKTFVKSIKGKYTVDKDGLVTIMNDSIEFHFKSFNKHLELVELTTDPENLEEAQRCVEFLRYESYLLQKNIYCETEEEATLSFLCQQGFRRITEQAEKEEVCSSFWENERIKA